ncbi:MAG TPA: hypothetical protein VJ725_24425 [Thermoanaerobaculia bacterium]|nr:hypothetical protein [Thermoanaerobaculia bacterium]
MITKNPVEPIPPASSSSDAQAPVLDPRSPIEVASTGDGTVNDPTAKDRPPGAYDDLEGLA